MSRVPGPLHEFVVKLSSRCNLACDYCYVFAGPDQSWRDRPAVMTRATIVATANRIAEHARAHGLRQVLVALHGGEPLLAGPEYTEFVLTTITNALPDGVRPRFVVQTNGILLSPEFLDLFARHQVRVGVSLDGGQAATDRHRVRANGKSAYPETTAGLRLLASARYRPLFAGLLCVVDLASEPVASYRDLISFEPPSIDLLLPHGHWSRPPPRPPGSRTAYADWLIAVFDQWYRAPVTRIRIFEEAVALLLGGAPRTEALGGAPPAYAVVETDGAIEGIDSLKITYPGAAATGLTVHEHSFDLALTAPALAGPRLGLSGLSSACTACSVVSVCGGGQYAHRFRAGSGFANPSVYCADLRRMIEHIAARIYRDLREPEPACSLR